MLEKENPFDAKIAVMIKSFLNNCKTPICLVAHNGNHFDFPLLKEELIKFPNVSKS
jgi:three prime repair exonuclease-1